MGSTFSLLYIRSDVLLPSEHKCLVNGAECIESKYVRYDVAVSSDTSTDRDKNYSLLHNHNTNWLQLFSENETDEPIVSSDDIIAISMRFSATVLTFSVFDSDIITASLYNPNTLSLETHELSCYGQSDVYIEPDDYGVPEFLLEICDADKRNDLSAIWYSNKYIFAEDKLQDLCNLLGLRTYPYNT